MIDFFAISQREKTFVTLCLLLTQLDSYEKGPALMDNILPQEADSFLVRVDPFSEVRRKAF